MPRKAEESESKMDLRERKLDQTHEEEELPCLVLLSAGVAPGPQPPPSHAVEAGVLKA